MLRFLQNDYGQKLVDQDAIISNVQNDHSTTKTRAMTSEAQLASAVKRIAELTRELDDARVRLLLGLACLWFCFTPGVAIVDERFVWFA